MKQLKFLKNGQPIPKKRQIAPQKIKEYKVPKEILVFLNENYSKDEAISVLRYIIVLLKEAKGNSLLNWLLEDANELKITLNLLENKKIQTNKELDDLCFSQIVDILEKYADNILLVKEFWSVCTTFKQNDQYEHLFEFILKEIRKEKQEKKTNSSRDFWKKKKKKTNSIKNDKEMGNLIVEDEIPSRNLYKTMVESKKKAKNDDEITHEWNQTAIRFKNADGTWGKWVDLRPQNEGNNTIKRGGGGGIGKRKVQSMIDDTIAALDLSQETGFPTSFSLEEKYGETYVTYSDFQP